jgi:hypothetical protein
MEKFFKGPPRKKFQKYQSALPQEKKEENSSEK